MRENDPVDTVEVVETARLWLPRSGGLLPSARVRGGSWQLECEGVKGEEQNWLVVWLPWILFSHINWECQTIPIDELIFFQRGGQKPTREAFAGLPVFPVPFWGYQTWPLSTPPVIFVRYL